MPSFLKSVFKFAVLSYQFLQKLRVDHRVNRELEEQAQRIQSQRYQQASNTAGHEAKK